MPSVGTFKLFIGNLDEKTQPSELKPLFEKYGTVVECGKPKQDKSTRNKPYIRIFSFL